MNTHLYLMSLPCIHLNGIHEDNIPFTFLPWKYKTPLTACCSCNLEWSTFVTCSTDMINFVKVWKFRPNEKHSVMFFSFYRSSFTLWLHHNGCRNKMVSTLTLYLHGPSFKFQSTVWLDLLRSFMVFLSLPMLGYLKIGHDCFLPHLYKPYRCKIN